MKKPHQINLAELQQWMLETETLYASDGNGKRLFINTSGNFVLRINGEIVWTGNQPFDAVEIYNSL